MKSDIPIPPCNDCLCLPSCKGRVSYFVELFSKKTHTTPDFIKSLILSWMAEQCVMFYNHMMYLSDTDKVDVLIILNNIVSKDLIPEIYIQDLDVLCTIRNGSTTNNPKDID